jgi:hypothetical protein
MAFLNLSFEDIGASAGLAANWTYTTSTPAIVIAGYNTPEEPWEPFERGWLFNEDYIFAFGVGDVVFAEYATVLVANKFVEDFNEKWDQNESYAFAFGGVAAQYNSTLALFDGFGREWSSNESYKFAFVGAGTDLTLAEYDVALQLFEDFQQEWQANESYKYAFVGVGSDLTAALYDAALTAFENFENEFPTLVMTTI